MVNPPNARTVNSIRNIFRLIDFSEAQEAIVVTPDYRLIPEANGLEQLDDVQDLWKWVHQSLPTEISKISSKLSVNLDRIAVAGESAGKRSFRLDTNSVCT